MEWVLDIVLILLLAATLLQALRLERALGVLKRDRAELETLIAGFNASTAQAELGIERLRHAADGAGRQIARQVEAANGLKDDLVFLSERGGKLADRLDGLVRTAGARAPEARPNLQDYFHDVSVPSFEPPRARLNVQPDQSSELADLDDECAPRLRSQAERDLLKALRLAR